MGSIYYIATNPKRWRTYDSGLRLRDEYGGETLTKIIYGTFDDYPCEFELEMYMRKSVYEKLINNEYFVSSKSSFMHRLVILDANGNEVTPLSDTIY